MNVKKALILIRNEYDRASVLFPPFTSGHEGYAIILEELDELWDAVKKQRDSREFDYEIRREAVQVAAMALRYLVDLGGA